MAVVANEYTRWAGHTGAPGDIGRLLVWANDTGQHLIDHVEIDNVPCTDTVRVQVVDDDGVSVLFDQVVLAGGTFSWLPPRNIQWTRNTQAKVGQWDVRVSTWAV